MNAAPSSSVVSCRLIPALDLLGGRAVRLLKGDYRRVTDYGDPRHWTSRWWSQGARELHLVDLEGARSGRSGVLDLVAEWAAQGWQVQVGGGLRDTQAVRQALEAGADRVVLGTAAIREPDFLPACIAAFGAERIVPGLDLEGEVIKVSGWREGAGERLDQVLDRWASLGLRRALSTAVLRDGTLEGPDLDQYRRLQQALPDLDWIASGGLRYRSDLDALACIGIGSAVSGKALLEGWIATDTLWR
jgi:phosphoribosylformimino-5-aminoimidazole carboxamide ribotide isomerase